jgi:cyclase
MNTSLRIGRLPLLASSSLAAVVAFPVLWPQEAPAAGVRPSDSPEVALKTTPVAGNVSVIEGANGFAGGNIAVLAGDDGVLLVDDALQTMAPKLVAAVTALSKKPMRFVVDTHWHSDHSGGNAALAAQGALVVAHENTRRHLSIDQTIEFGSQKLFFPAQPAEALPSITFSDEAILHLNGDDVQLFHAVPSHTDGDLLVRFAKANVIHMGDTFVIGYPVVDSNSGGRYDGLVANADRVLAMCDQSTKIIPGHGAVTDRAKLKVWRDMLVAVRDRVAKLAVTKTLDEIRAAKPTADYDAVWNKGLVKPDLVVEMAYASLPAASKNRSGQ